MKILDEGENKFICEVIEMKQRDLYYLCVLKNSRVSRVKVWSDEISDYSYSETDNLEWKEAPPRIVYAMNKKKEYECGWDYLNYPKGPRKLEDKFVIWAGGEDNVYEYLDIKPFTASVMINISPDWAVLEKRTQSSKANILKGILDKYLSEGWYQKWAYVIENGSKGDHIHAHCVCELNRERLKSSETHLAKGNHSQQLKKYANKLKGCQGLIKGVSVQKCMLRNETLVKDKLDYLIEEKKPEGHKNLSIINDGYIEGSL